MPFAIEYVDDIPLTAADKHRVVMVERCLQLARLAQTVSISVGALTRSPRTDKAYGSMKQVTFERVTRAAIAFAFISMGPGCEETRPDMLDNRTVAEDVISSIVGACPPAAADDADARQRCADDLSSSPMANAFANVISFGAQQQPNSYEHDSGLTHLASRVALRIYLPLFYATGGYVEVLPDSTAVAHVQVGFRGGLSQNEYPYPFWHSDAKWTNYNTTKEMLYVVSGGQVVAAMRSKDVNLARPVPPHAWDGQWTQLGSDGRIAEPHVSLYRNIFTAENPHLNEVETAYYDFANFVRKYQCETCHAPSNQSSMPMLSIVNIPAQALVYGVLTAPDGTSTLSGRIEIGAMPALAPELGVVLQGIPQGAEREEAMRLAANFAAQARAALQFDAEGR